MRTGRVRVLVEKRRVAKATLEGFASQSLDADVRTLRAASETGNPGS